MTPLIVRLPNHLGDACMSIAALDALAAAGYALTLAGRPWLASLFEAYSWPTVALRGSRREHIRALRATASGSRGLLFTNSFSTALEFRLAGIASTGYARGGRSLLLSQAVPVNDADHMVEYYHRLASNTVRSVCMRSSGVAQRSCISSWITVTRSSVLISLPS